MFAYYSRWIKNFSNKIRPLVKINTFQIPEVVKSAFDALKNDLKDVSLIAIAPCKPSLLKRMLPNLQLVLFLRKMVDRLHSSLEL